ncbi:MAG TPA: GNAT family N-acetyltransferase [Microbacteriaceae bacterium]|nr:GNAT family N-acetyltransferase [Microbacteriaceae bacterium]
MTSESSDPTWLPAGFAHPIRVDLGGGYHLRPIRADDVDIDMLAVMGSRERLWSIYGPSWGWPPADMTREQDYEDLAHHELEIENNESFNYALLSADESALFGCIYIDPSTDAAIDAEVSWWVVDDLVGTGIEAELAAFVPRWLREEWPLQTVSFH